MRNWFEQGGEAYRRYRPEYPAGLARCLAEVAPDRGLAIDVGCGNGQLTVHLARYFGHVLGVDPSADQLAHAAQHPRIEYRCAPAESLPIADHSAALLVAAQAAHWFDLPRFYGEVRRAGVAGAAVALVSYGVPVVPADIAERFASFYGREAGPYWPPERAQVESGYRDLAFPFEELEVPALAIRLQWSLAEFLGYVSTWSAVRRLREDGRDALLQTFGSDLALLWGPSERVREISWPINVRLGRL